MFRNTPPNALRVPLALSGGRLLAPAEAAKGMPLSCPDCGGELILRDGELVTRHFAHRDPPPKCAMVGERWEHVQAKLLLAKAVADWKSGATASPRLRRRCPACKARRIQPLPPRVETAALEFRWQTPRGLVIADVALLDAGGAPVAFIEVLETHAVDEPKRDRLQGIPWFEIRARHVLRKPWLWIIVQEGNLKGLPCGCPAPKAAASAAPRRRTWKESLQAAWRWLTTP